MGQSNGVVVVRLSLVVQLVSFVELSLDSNPDICPDMRSFSPVFLVLLLLPLSQALHFYLDANEQKCFMEELPMDTIVEGPLTPSPRSLVRSHRR